MDFNVCLLSPCHAPLCYLLDGLLIGRERLLLDPPKAFSPLDWASPQSLHRGQVLQLPTISVVPCWTPCSLSHLSRTESPKLDTGSRCSLKGTKQKGISTSLTLLVLLLRGCNTESIRYSLSAETVFSYHFQLSNTKYDLTHKCSHP